MDRIQTLFSALMISLLGMAFFTGLALAQDGEGSPTDPAEAAPTQISETIFPLDLPAPPLSTTEQERAAEFNRWWAELNAAVDTTEQNSTALQIHVHAPIEVSNGDQISYTITVTNAGSVTARNISLRNVLPVSSLQDVVCTPDNCTKIEVSVPIKDQFGDDILISEITAVSWAIAEIAPGANRSRSFSAKVVGQSDGLILKNQAFASYQLDGQSGSQTVNSNEVRSTVRVRVIDGRGLTISSVPTWFSSDRGGTLNMDWGDYDRDGDLDLALASSGGTTLYRNDNGQMRRIWSNSRPSFGVRWGDFTGDGSLDLVVVGNQADDKGINYLYTIDNDVVQEQGSFTTDFPLARVATGDFDRSGALDLVLSTNAINAPCPVLLYKNDGKGVFSPAPNPCISERATASIGVFDTNNNGDLDLVLGLFPNTVQIFLNNGQGKFTAGPIIDNSIPFLPYDFSVGDYDGDGYLDLAAAYPLLRQARIYRNQAGAGFSSPIIIRTDRFLTPFSLDWGDFTGDGNLDLAVADVRPTVYAYDRTNNEFRQVDALSTDSVSVGGRVAQIWTLRGVDVDNDGDLDLTMTNRDGSSLLFTSFVPHLSSTLTPVPEIGDTTNSPASSVVWADFDGDGYLDLLFGAGPLEVGTKRYLNRRSRFLREDQANLEGFGPHVLAVGDVNKDGRMDIAIGTSQGIAIYLAESVASPAQTIPLTSRPTALAWGDYDDDGDLDLLVGAEDGSILLFKNQTTAGGGFDLTQLAWESPTKAGGPVTSLAWADLTRNHYLDFAAGIDGAPNRIYINDMGQNVSRTSFTLSSWTPKIGTNDLKDPTRALAWGDYDGDGRIDLAVGNYAESNYIYRNLSQGGQFVMENAPKWISPNKYKTTSLAWGDWNNSGVLDLAVGNYEEVDQVWVNRRDPNVAGNGDPKFSWLWSSSEKQKTTGIAWGDVDLDGDLDLAVSQEGGGSNGYYLNHLITPAHITDNYASKIQLPDNLNYLHVYRPGTANSAYFHSTPQVIGSSNQPTVTVQFQVYDPNGRRNVPGSNALGSPIPFSAFRVELSLDGGGTWKPATGSLLQASVPVQNESLSFKDVGQRTTRSFFLPEGIARFRVKHSGQRNFIVKLVDTQKAQDNLLFNEIGPFEGEQVQRISPESCFILNVDADGDWEIDIELSSSSTSQSKNCATQAQTEPSIIPTRLGTPVTFIWNARADAAISEHALIRVTLIQVRSTGSTNRASVAAISPPFRVRATSCEWPHTASLRPTVVERALTPVEFIGSARATGLVTFQWDFGDGNKGVGQRTYHQYAHDGTYPVTLTVTGQPCPVTRPLVMTTNVRVGTGISPTMLYLPVIYGGGAPPAAARSAQVAPPPPVTNLVGDERANGTVLSWDPPVDADAVTAYRIYRQTGDGELVRLTRLSAGSTSYRDAGIHCGALYFVTAVGPGGESAASNQTFYTSSCTGES